MRGLEERAEAVAGSFNAQDVANTLWAVCVLAMRNVISNAVVQVLFARVVSLCETPDKSLPWNTAQLRQLHQFFVSCSLEEKMRVDKLNDVPALTRFAARHPGTPSTCSYTTAPWRREGRGAAGGGRAQWSLTGLRTSCRA